MRPLFAAILATAYVVAVPSVGAAQSAIVVTTEVPWYVVVPQAPGSLAGITDVEPDPSPNPCGQQFRIVAGRLPGEPECVGKTYGERR
jgi:hypothetical protein